MFNRYFHKYNGFDLAVTALVAAVFLLGSDGHAFAKTATLGDMFCNVYYQLNSPDVGYVDVFNYVAYTSGVICIVQGIYHLYMHAESPKNHKMSVPLFLLLGGTLLMMLPATAATIITSIYGKNPDGGIVTCAATAPAGGPGLDGMLAGFVSNIYQPGQTVISIIAILAGVAMMIRGLMKASKYGVDPRTHSVNSILANIIFGALLMTIGTNLDVMLGSLLGTGTVEDGAGATLAWSAKVTDGLGGASAQFQTAVNSALYFVELIGYIAFVRGWMILKKVVEGGGNVTMAQGITHVVGGVLAINIFDFLKTMDTTFGTNLLS